jgi:branched-chain amino acid transport system ATP-binding protein
MTGAGDGHAGRAGRGTPAGPPVLSVEGVTKDFGPVRAVDDLTLAVAAGERRAVIGPNGAGKTTLFNLIGGQLAPTRGRVRLLGEDVTGWPVHARARAGLARTFQATNLLPELSVRENVLLAVAAHLPAARRSPWRPLGRVAEVADGSEALLADWGLADVADEPVAALAHGQQRVLEVVLALAAEPRILLLDEPTAGLTSAEAQRMVGIVAALPADLTLLIIEHDMDVAFALADTVHVLADGRMLATGSPEEVRRDPDVVAVYLGAVGDA